MFEYAIAVGVGFIAGVSVWLISERCWWKRLEEEKIEVLVKRLDRDHPRR